MVTREDDELRYAAERASRILADMLSFSRRSMRRFEPVSAVDMLGVVRLASSDYDLKKKYDFKVSYFIVAEQHKGTFSVNSTPGRGTCFVIRLPLKIGP